EHVAEVPAAAPAMHLGAHQQQEAAVLGCPDCPLDRRPEARPAGPAVELGIRGVQRQIACGAQVGAGPIFLVERARSGALGAVLTKHGVLLLAQLATPLLVGFDDLERFLRRSRHGTLRESRPQKGGYSTENDVTTAGHAIPRLQNNIIALRRLQKEAQGRAKVGFSGVGPQYRRLLLRRVSACKTSSRRSSPG